MTDPYATWNPATATHDPDGLPDVLMVPVVERLRAAGVVTFQSCQGHAGHSDAVLWFRAPLTDEQARALAAMPGMGKVARMYSPEDCWEAWWVASDRDRVGYDGCVAAIERAALAATASPGGESTVVVDPTLMAQDTFVGRSASSAQGGESRG